MVEGLAGVPLLHPYLTTLGMVSSLPHEPSSHQVLLLVSPRVRLSASSVPPFLQMLFPEILLFSKGKYLYFPYLKACFPFSCIPVFSIGTSGIWSALISLRGGRKVGIDCFLPSLQTLAPRISVIFLAERVSSLPSSDDLAPSLEDCFAQYLV